MPPVALLDGAYEVKVNASTDSSEVVFAFHRHSPSGGHPEVWVARTQPQVAGQIGWEGRVPDPGVLERFEAEIHTRLRDRQAWLDRVGALIDQVEGWARELGWSTRRIDKTLDDSRIGRHRVQALLLQEATCRLLLEPIGRSSPGTEGVVDLYRMPAYDDIATLYFSQGEWHLHYPFSGSTEAMPLGRDCLERALKELQAHADQ